MESPLCCCCLAVALLGTSDPPIRCCAGRHTCRQQQTPTLSFISRGSSTTSTRCLCTRTTADACSRAQNAATAEERRKGAYRPAGGLCANEPCPGAEIRGEEEQRSPASQPGLPCNSSARGFREQSCPPSTTTSPLSLSATLPSSQHDVAVEDGQERELAEPSSHWPRHILRWFM
ncbi:hypothetical protein M409DRAFT_59405 [Zasmidium cellare ATCC 36951]|uniref:Secreted protein n=1 Tax=Zasmidium cellare ATCC 36951 TaxID=1080233 RepID=A0A6A6C2I3_ZASCE|nr:uncharacterized protein M409DRAFT_59405 [Zasmidium cellare ATCC 36951]KAF2161143.1 hypothetical protein M409DRAFT_59405 [Zasmidium cellare ATCC 36951]